MKKYLMTAAAVLTFGGLLTSCSHDFESISAEESVAVTYEKAFITAFGQPAPTQTWGFGTTTKASTRTITVPGTTDTYDTFTFPTTEELSDAFPEKVPTGADEISNLTTIYNSTDLWNIYKSREDGHNYVITTTGEVEIGGSWDNKVWSQENGTVMLSYNVYVNIGNNNSVTLKRNGTERMNLYILSGNVTLGSRNGNEFGEFGGTISVAEGATLNIPGTHLAHNDGIKVYNRGTINFTREAGFDIGNKCTFYNENITTSTGPLSYSPGAGNASYFINYSDVAELTAPSITFNSECHFYTDGTVDIDGETKVTQAGIVWINNGHYTTGSMKFSAHNGTFYNYCQLIVENNCAFTDGLFNMMDNSYAEFGTALFNNFHVNMGNNAGFNVKNGSKWGQQGAGIIQGFFAKNDNTTAFVRLAGTTFIPAHKGYAFQASGAKLTIASEDMKFYKSFNFYGDQAYANSQYWDEVTESSPLPQGDERGLADFGNTIQVSGTDFSNVGFTLTEGSCAATWDGPTPEPEPTPTPTPTPTSDVVRVIAEDLTASSGNDFDFNDVVFDVELASNNKVNITLRAAGGTLPLYIGQGDEAVEVHEKFGRATNIMINTGGSYANCEDGLSPQTFQLTNPLTGSDASNVRAVAKAIMVQVLKNVNGTNTLCELRADQGEATAKLCVGTDYEYTENGVTYPCLTERTDIGTKFIFNSNDQLYKAYRGLPKFKLYVSGTFGDDWYKTTAVPVVE